jgi:hypothetical protein
MFFFFFFSSIRFHNVYSVSFLFFVFGTVATTHIHLHISASFSSILSFASDHGLAAALRSVSAIEHAKSEKRKAQRKKAAHRVACSCLPLLFPRLCLSMPAAVTETPASARKKKKSYTAFY